MGGNSRPRPFSNKLFSLLTIILALLFILTVSSRLGYLNLLGVSIVLTDSMEPSLRPWDMALYLNANYTVGDVVVYCLTPSHSVVHRVVGFITLDTASGRKVMVVTKGDNVNVTDSPIEPGRVRGKVVLSIPRELWAPAALALLIYALYGLAKAPALGLSFMLLFSVSFVSIAAVYTAAPGPIAISTVELPLLSLAGVYFDQKTCTVTIRYTGGLSITSAVVRVNSTEVSAVLLSAREIAFKPSPDLLRRAFESGRPLAIAVNATLNNVGRMQGEYALLVGGLDPGVGTANGTLIIKNPNCFPIALNVSIRYLHNGTWLWSNRTYIVEGFSCLAVKPPEGAEFSYAYIYWFNQGDRRWMGVPLRRS